MRIVVATFLLASGAATDDVSYLLERTTVSCGANKRYLRSHGRGARFLSSRLADVNFVGCKAAIARYLQWSMGAD